MTSYLTIADSEVDPDAPLTSGLAYRWRDNPIAMFEGATGAPKLMPQALDLYLGPVDVTDTTASGLTGLDGIDALMVSAHFATASTARPQFSLSDDGGSTWGSWYDLIASNITSPPDVDGIFLISLKSARLMRMVSTASMGGRYTGYAIPGAGANAIRFRFTTSGGQTAKMEIFGIGTFA